MDSETYFATAAQHAEGGRFDAAVAYAQLATAAAVMRLAGQPVAIYPGDHQPLPADWCGTCSSPGRRVTADRKDCPRCNPRSLRARPCRHCGVHLEERMDGNSTEGSWAWRDEKNSLNCPKAPDPAAPLPVPVQAERDVNPDRVWSLFFQEWNENRALSEEPASSETLLATTTLLPYMPRTRLGERPHAEHLDAWLAARAGQPHGPLQVKEDPPADSPSVRTWRLTTA
ncbi:hypothetical protein [Streptomyces sp. W4I9-2]|uniref:hypothetical protein n=1 Tax=Streptomyces sp. W4I9-2 TaxID=3042297 RepID=UPI0027844DE5|nr:hypothetical protein [Streptomyces sp. W4I9-2]MDQ0701054.1 hypothetical protein [Streptomyces sp. W4I9-2]